MQTIEQGTKAWHDWRSQGIGASEAPDIMGVGYLTPYQLWCERLGISAKRETTAYMQRGSDLEPIARGEFERVMGFKMTPSLKIHPKIDWMRCSLDGISEDEKAIVEIKCPNAKRHEMAMKGMIPPEYYPQVQHQIEVCGVDKAYYFSFDGSNGRVLEIDRDESYIKALISQELAFWTCLKELEEPKLSDRDYEHRLDADWCDTTNQWKEDYKILKIYEEKVEKHRLKLIELAQNANCEGNGVRVARTIRKGLVDYKAIPELKVVNLDEYRKKPVESWRIGVI